MERHERGSRTKDTARRIYEPPRLRTYGSLARIVKAKPGANNDNITHNNTKNPP